jgi:alpha-L-fucosidase
MAVIKPATPYGPVPTERQLKWYEMELYGFIHFTTNTFTDKECDYGDESPAVFSPSPIEHIANFIPHSLQR